MFYWVVKVFLTPVLRLFWRPWVEGAENIPLEGPAILAGNHLSFLDHLFLSLVVPRRVTYLAKSDYFTEAGVKGWFKRVFFSGVGQIPIDRSGGKASEGALRSGVRVLRQGRLLGIYPEGTRSPDGRLYRGKVGVARLALEAGVPVIPVAMIGTFEVQPPGQLVPKIRRVGIRIGRPLDFSRYAAMADDRFVLRSVTDEIMYELMALSGQEYVDLYAKRAKEELAAARAQAAAGAAAASTGTASVSPASTGTAPGSPGAATPARSPDQLGLPVTAPANPRATKDRIDRAV
ncbi:1-acyl-sn-glycerol-3-phosphate acyltransferase [Frankia sp. CcI156]|uniref:lysophospholipid acyltransferase family protein n=1 Tax=unclassified Frankia TaxID=2632575 RepID=UPI0002DC0931|nr:MULTISPECIES: lysophospholipid acyltransferase family protein [Frankia]OFB45137.1 glycerol acyltransferase [Frankia sp. CgIM4]OHV53155.1 glycerol acyltransferase [Frankia sp. CgIS1]ONH24622.1 1-acyl-sn-glycerol-3-phosphate acyltransferase [Frankia sp. CcI156]ORT54251.1 1-acyl-sn-glycerol-3-phosphate acyltransferase [Frankia sp. KB5]TFE33540.1 1-acyl-sn-glycerol-3-phosphate acyltransferase [Frankia sp. B2]